LRQGVSHAPDLLDALGVGEGSPSVRSVCNYARVADAVVALEGTNIPVAAVSTDFRRGKVRSERLTKSRLGESGREGN
jgi:hypothetical protein